MTRLIDADDIVLDYSGLANISPLDFRGTAEYFAKQIDSMPTIDAVPVKHGKWENSRPDAPMFGFYYCSLCGRKRTSPQDRYCPNCGARMDEE